MNLIDIDTLFGNISTAIELAGTIVITFGVLYSTVIFLRGKKSGEPSAYSHYRKNLGRSILLGLEFLVAGDIVSTVTVEPDFRSVGILAIVVLIRTFLSFTLDVEIHGRWPWQKERTD